MKNLISFMFLLTAVSTYTMAAEDLATKTGNNPLKQVSRIDFGYTAAIQDSGYGNINHDFRIAGYYAVTGGLSLGFELPLISFTNPNTLPGETHVTAGDVKAKIFGSLYLSDNEPISEDASMMYGVAAGTEITLPTGKAEYQTGGNAYVFDTWIATGILFNTTAGTTVVAPMIRYVPKLSVDSNQFTEHALDFRLILSHIFKRGYFISEQVNAAISLMNHQRYEFYNKVVLGAMFTKQFGMTLEVTNHIYGDYLTQPEGTYQLWFRYLFV